MMATWFAFIRHRASTSSRSFCCPMKYRASATSCSSAGRLCRFRSPPGSPRAAGRPLGSCCKLAFGRAEEPLRGCGIGTGIVEEHESCVAEDMDVEGRAADGVSRVSGGVFSGCLEPGDILPGVRERRVPVSGHHDVPTCSCLRRVDSDQLAGARGNIRQRQMPTGRKAGRWYRPANRARGRGPPYRAPRKGLGIPAAPHR